MLIPGCLMYLELVFDEAFLCPHSLFIYIYKKKNFDSIKKMMDKKTLNEQGYKENSSKP